MNGVNECRFFHRTFPFDGHSARAQCKNLKFKRAFQFLQILLLQRVYGIDVITRSPLRRPRRKPADQYEVFLGGSCNPTTWRCEQAIPYLQARSISYFNPQVTDWRPELVEIEHRVKELAPVLFFVIDHQTRSLAAIAEVSYLAACRRNVIVVINAMPEDRKQVKFIQLKKDSNEDDDERDYENACEARRTLKRLLQCMNVPMFESITVALECTTFLLESTEQTTIRSDTPDAESKEESGRVRCSVCDSPDDCYHQLTESEMTSSSPVSSHRRHSATHAHVSPMLSPCVHSNHFTTGVYFRRTSIPTKTQLSMSSNESDDDGYGSLGPSYRTLSPSSSSSSIFSDLGDPSTDKYSTSRFSASISIVSNVLINVFLQLSLITPPVPLHSSFSQLLTVFYKRTKYTLLPPVTRAISSDGDEFLFDLYVAAGDDDQCWFRTSAVPLLDELNLKYIQRHTSHDNDELDTLCDIHIRRRSRLLYYVINDRERLSQLATELAFLLGERRHHIVVCLQAMVNENAEKIATKAERQDIERSRKYLEDIAKKEKILLYHSREQSWQHVLAFFLRK